MKSFKQSVMCCCGWRVLILWMTIISYAIHAHELGQVFGQGEGLICSASFTEQESPWVLALQC